MNKLNNEDLKKIEREKIKDLAEEYEFKVKTIKRYYETIMMYPFVKNDTSNKKWECLEMIVQDRYTQKTFYNNADAKRSLSDTICDSLYRVYDEESVDYLNEEFLKTHEIGEKNYDYQYVYEQGYSYTDRQYHGYN